MRSELNIPQEIKEKISTLNFKELDNSIDVLTDIMGSIVNNKKLSNLLINSVNALTDLLVDLNHEGVPTGRSIKSWRIGNIP
jgi:hypothetical protein